MSKKYILAILLAIGTVCIRLFIVPDEWSILPFLVVILGLFIPKYHERRARKKNRPEAVIEEIRNEAEKVVLYLELWMFSFAAMLLFEESDAMTLLIGVISLALELACILVITISVQKIGKLEKEEQKTIK